MAEPGLHKCDDGTKFSWARVLHVSIAQESSFSTIDARCKDAVVGMGTLSFPMNARCEDVMLTLSRQGCKLLHRDPFFSPLSLCPCPNYGLQCQP